MDKHIIGLYNQALKDYDELLDLLDDIKKICVEAQDNTGAKIYKMIEEAL